MDVHCSTCGEPWDTYHLQHDVIYETDLNFNEMEHWRTLSPRLKLQPRYREKFASLGWRFGQTILNVISCPCCPKDATPTEEIMAIKAALEDVLGDDEDGLAATYEDYHL